jgi:hypothetical protein
MAADTSIARVTANAKTGKDGVHIDVGLDRLEQAGIHAGDDVVLELRRYTAEDWLADNDGRIYYSTEEFDEAMEEYLALPEGIPPQD